MIDAYFYSFSKRDNSTAKPSGEGYHISVAFKETTDLEKPTLELHDSNVVNYNYCRIPAYSKYYRVAAKRSIAAGEWEIDLVEDYLATWISSIMGQNVYCSMSSVDFDTLLDDSRVVPIPLLTQVPQTASAESFDVVTVPYSDGAAPLLTLSMVVAKYGNINGLEIVTSWDTSTGNYLEDIANPSIWQQIAINMGAGNPMDYVAGVWAVPFKPGACHDVTSDTIEIGGRSYDVDRIVSTRLTANHYEESFQVPLPTHGDFRFSEPYVFYYLLLPFIGAVKIPTDIVRQSSHLITVSWSANCISGEITYSAKIGGVHLGIFSTTLKCELPIKSQTSAASHMITGGITTAFKGAGIGAAAGGPWGAIGGAIAGGVSGVVKGAINGDDVERVLSAVDSAGLASMFGDINKPTVVMIEHESDIDPATLTPFGRPCEKVVTVKPGYMQTRNASLSFPGTESELAAVNAAFNNGVYVE